jgi:hypothetical protein
MQERRATDARTMERRGSGPQLPAYRERDAPGAGCLPLAPSGHVGAGAQLTPRPTRTGNVS